MNVIPQVFILLFALFGYRFDHTAITHRGEPELDPLVSRALEAWGRHSAIIDGSQGNDIAIVFSDEPDGPGGLAVPYGAYEPHYETMHRARVETLPSCEIRIARRTYNLLSVDDPAWLQRIVMHEVGHCLGLDHPAVYDETCVMSSTYAECRRDALAMAYLYPRLTYTLTIGGLAR